jgi:hypothetical protein
MFTKETTMSKQQKLMSRWSDEKLDRERAFAEGSVGDDPRAAQWLADIKAEVHRRGLK